MPFLLRYASPGAVYRSPCAGSVAGGWHVEPRTPGLPPRPDWGPWDTALLLLLRSVNSLGCTEPRSAVRVGPCFALGLRGPWWAGQILQWTIISKEKQTPFLDFHQSKRLPRFCCAVSYIFPPSYFLRAGNYTLIFVYVQSLKSWKILPIKAVKKRGSARASFVQRALQAMFLLQH